MVDIISIFTSINRRQNHTFAMDKRIKDVMAKAFDVPAEQITESSTQDTIENWDSIHHIQMIVLMERAFDITIPDEYVGKMITFKLINEIVHKCYESRI
jgi:acyl carrier protein